LNIVYIDQTGQLGGGELSLLDLLASVRLKTRVILFEDGPFRSLLEEIGETVEILPMEDLSLVRRGASLSSIFWALPNLRKFRARLSASLASADVLYANSQKAFLLVSLSKRRGQPIVWHLRDLLTKDHFSTILRRLAVFAGNRFATVIIVNSQATADAFIAEGGRADKLRLVPDGIDPKLYDAVNLAVAERLHAELCPPGMFLIGLFGRLAHWKGQHILLEAVACMKDVQICLVGDALFGESAYAEEIKERASEPDLAGRVHFLGFRRDIPELMTAMDLVVHTSVSAEPLGRVIVEGMLARKPVIATRAGGAAEIVEDEVSGLLVSPGSVEELQAAIDRLRSDPVLQAKLASAGRHRAETVYSLQSMVDRTTEVLREVHPRER
jgi:glycosyltransferase involved in cell wall biosynthesis